VTLNDSISLPGIEDNLARLSGSSVFSGVDGAGAYHCVGVHKAVRPKTAFSTPFGLWQFKCLPFGLCNAPATYTHLVQMVLEGISYDEALPYLDDTCIHSKDLEGHYVAMREVFDAYRHTGLKIQPSKCHLFQAEIEYLGHFISKDGVSRVPKYVQVVQKWPLPKNKTETRSFLGKVGYYRRFIKDSAAIAKPWTDIVGKDENREIEKAPIVAMPTMVASYRHLKQALLTSPVLAYPQFDSKEPFILDTDWLGDANTIGGVLSQKQCGREKVIAYGAQKLSRSQQNYAPTKGELWAIVHFCRYWRYLLQHHSVPFIIRTDHQSLQYMEGMEPPSGMIMRWFDTLSNFNFLIEHRPGKKHANADALSRCAHAEEPDPDDEPDEMIAMMHEMINVLEPCVPNWDPAHICSQQLMDSDLEMIRTAV
jgi:hypothetical protein